MQMTPDNFLYHVQGIVTGGGRDASGNPHAGSGFLKRAEGVSLQTITPTTAVTATAGALTVADGAGTNDGTIAAITADASAIAAVQELAAAINALIVDVAALRAQVGLTADETNARVLKVEEAIDSVGNLTWAVPRDYDEAADSVTVRVLASMVSVSTDTDVELDMEAYVKTAGSALGSDLDPTAPGTVLSATEQWVEFDLGGNGINRDDVLTVELITNGANDTNGEEILIHAVELVYRSTLVSYYDETTGGVTLR